MLGWLLMFGATLYILAALKFAQMAYRAVIRAYPNLKIQDASANTLGWSSGVGIMRMVGRVGSCPKKLLSIWLPSFVKPRWRIGLVRWHLSCLL